MTKEVKSLTSLRAIAAGLVFFYHVLYLRHPAPAKTILDAIIQNGFIGVTIFFVLSGFVLTMRYYHEVSEETFRWGSYLKRRVTRIYPLYFLLLAGLALWGLPLNIANVTLTQGFFSQLYQTGIIVAWSLTAEACFYLMLPLVLGILVNLKRLSSVGIVLLVWTVGMLGVGALLMNWSNASGIARQVGFMSDWTFIIYRTVFGYIFDFSVGIFAAVLLLRRGRPYGTGISTLLGLFGVVGLIAFQVFMSQHQDPYSLKLLVYGAAICIAVLILSLTCEATILSRALSWGPLVYMGRISYAVYLLQLTQLVWFMSDWPPLLFYAGTVLISAGLEQFFEEPVRRLLLRKPQSPQPPLLKQETTLAQ